jgi:hypothetical protein
VQGLDFFGKSLDTLGAGGFPNELPFFHDPNLLKVGFEFAASRFH